MNEKVLNKKSELVARFFGASLQRDKQARLAKDLLVFVAIYWRALAD